MASLLILAKLFSEHFRSAPNWALGLASVVWLAATQANMWTGVVKAGYSVMEELPVMLLLFLVPAAIAVLVRWRYL
ncbi:hypothetical protein [Shewanella sp. GXUN23E]|uniref:hypothetical protein n=1 Tax=Shewanella sp. GXUN23E TaxID=3422498 RepID=UPI003D7DA053